MNASEFSLNGRSFFIIFIVCVVGLSFSSSLGNGFTNYDDNAYLTENPLVRSLALKNIQQIFTQVRPHTIYVPLVTFSYTLEYKMWGLHPTGFHCTNLLLHILNTLLLFFLLNRIFSHPFLALASSLLFALHPLRVESVAWITERKDLLFTFFCLWALHSYLLFLKKESGRYYIYSLILFLCAVLSKPSALIFPLLLILIDWVVETQVSKKRWMEKIPFVILSVLLALIYFNFVSASPSGENLQKIEVMVKNSLWAIPFYLEKTIFPFRISMRYPTDMRFFMPPLVISLLFSFICIIGSFFLFRKNKKEWIWGWGVFLIPLIPVFRVLWHFFPITNRYSYLPSMGLSFLLVYGLAFGFTRWGKYISIIKKILIIFGAGILLILGTSTFQLCRVWKNSLTLWNDIIEKYPMIPIAFNNRGNVLSNLGRLDEAIDDYSSAIQLNPSSSEAYWNRGLVWVKKGQIGQADEDFFHAVRLEPAFFKMYCRMQISKSGIQGIESALALGRRVVQSAPTPDIHIEIAKLLILSKQGEEAETHLKEAVRLAPKETKYQRLLHAYQNQKNE